jgi:DNA-binding CsgD family transcriptional regulator/PAS domain-containing protein
MHGNLPRQVIVSQEHRIIASIYEASQKPDLWTEVLEEMALMLRAKDARFDILNAAGSNTFFSVQIEKEAANGWSCKKINDVGKTCKREVKSYTRAADIKNKVCHENLVKSDSAQHSDLPSPIESNRLIGRVSDDKSDMQVRLEFNKDRNLSPFSRAETENFRYLSEHIHRSARMFYLAHVDIIPNLARSLLDQLVFGAIVTDGTGKIVWTNAAAEHHLALRKTICVNRERIEALAQGAQKRLRLLISNTAKKNGSGGGMQIPFINEQGAITLSMLPLFRQPKAPDSPETPLVIILISDLDARPTPTGRQLVDYFGLTPAEARLAVELAQGQTLETIAAQRRVQGTTLRTQLSAVLRKTDTVRQADLVRLIIGLPTAHLKQSG